MIITKNDILELSEPFEELYGDISNQILILMAQYLGKDINEPINIWQEKRIQEINLLLKKSQSIMSNMAYAQLITSTLNSVVDLSLEDIEPSLKEASDSGVLKKTTAPKDSKGLSMLKKNMKKDFLNTFNAMNIVMLQSIKKSYNKAIIDVSNTYSHSILDNAVDDVVKGETMQKAVAKAIRQMAKGNIPAFFDKSGRQWTPEAYVNMYVRTNVHNLSIDTVFKRNEDYDNDLYIVSKHSGARPKCAPYQGKIVSKRNRKGYVKDGNGKKYRFIPLSSTSYGEPDGLLGINCSHTLHPFIKGISIPHIDPLSKEEKAKNDKVYKESQMQRSIEREIRKSKQLEEMYKSAGLKDEAEAQKYRTRSKQEKMRKFIKETGRTRRTYREQIIK